MQLLYYIRKASLFIEKAMAYVSEHGGRYLQSSEKVITPDHVRKWTGKIVDLVEIVYAIDTKKCIENGNISIVELTEYLGQVFGVEVKDCYSAYVDMKHRKSESRTYFLDELRHLLNQRMEQDDQKK